MVLGSYCSSTDQQPGVPMLRTELVVCKLCLLVLTVALASQPGGRDSWTRPLDARSRWATKKRFGGGPTDPYQHVVVLTVVRVERGARVLLVQY